MLVKIYRVALFSVLTLFTQWVLAEGSYQAGLNQPYQDYASTGAPLYVDIQSAGEVINFAYCGSGSNTTGSTGTGDSITVKLFAPGSDPAVATPLATTTSVGNVDCGAALNAPLDPATLFQFDTTTDGAGTYVVTLDNVLKKDIDRLDITVTPDATTWPDPTATQGRLWAYNWTFYTGAFTEAVATNADYFALVPGGRANTNYVWRLDLNNFSGNLYTLVANDLGVNTPNSGYSVPTSGNGVTEKFPLYLNYPTIADPRPTEPPTLTGGLTFIDDAGQDYAISPGSTATFQDSGNFTFTSDVSGTYAITIDTNSDGIYGAGDRLLLGNMVVGLNTVPWDGTGPDGVSILGAGKYRAQLQARLGEYHFIANDAETSGGTLVDGLTIYLANDATTWEDTTVYWDDATFLTGSSNLPDGALASTAAGKHTWGNFTSTSIGNNAYIDTYVYGIASAYTAVAAIVSDDTLQTGVDGAIDSPASSAPGNSFAITVTDADIDILPGVAESATAVVTNSRSGEQEQVTLTETGLNTGIFTLSFNTADNAATGTNNDGTMNVQSGDTLTATYQDQLDSVGASVDFTSDTVITDATPPVITLLGNATVSIEQGATYTDAGATALDNIDGDITGNIVTVNPVDTDVVGSYTVTYNVSDAAGNAATQVTRTVNVTADATVPVITLLGNATVSIEQGATYTDAGATALDNIDGDITGDIVTVNPVDTNVVGSYTVTYNVSDAAGNAATQVTRTVNVIVDPVGDMDGDGISNGDEGYGDSDGDGIPDYLDLDSDNDGIPDSVEGNVDTDGDGIPDYLDLDSDNDGIHDLFESGINAPHLVDSDNDGRIDGEVGANGLADVVETAPDSGVINYEVADSDGDGVYDYRDLDSDNDGLNDVIEAGGSDPDGDGMIGSGAPAISVDGVPAGGPLAAIDTDGDLIPDFRDLDSDNDGLYDVVEAGGSDPDNDGRVGSGTPVVDADTGLPVGGSLTELDTDGDGVPDQRDLDSDNDGIPDVTENGGHDPDGDGIIGEGTPVVGEDGVYVGGGLVPVDTDGDGVPNQRDLDSDGDGTDDIIEAGGIDNDGDGMIDGYVDNNGDGFDDGYATTPLPLPDGDGDGVADFKDSDDRDADGVADALDLDSDNDGIPNDLEGAPDRDSDGDGIPDYLDLDSDNDGIFDLYESGIADPASLDLDGDGQIDSGFGSNGLADAIETSPDSGVIDYTLADTDGDGIPDYRDLDSDNDGIYDVIEAGNRDDDGDGHIGSGIPVVNDNGVPAGNNGMPRDTDGDGIDDQRDLDSDGDGTNDIDETVYEDSDGDGMIDDFNDSDGDGYFDNISSHSSGSEKIETGVRGIGGCTIASGQVLFDPLLPLLVLLALLGINRRKLRTVITGEQA